MSGLSNEVNEQALYKMFFSGLTPEDIQLLAGYGTRKMYPKCAVLINEGDPNGFLFVIISGKVKVYVSDRIGREVVLNFQGPGEIVGELALFDDGPRSASVMTQEPTTVSMLSKATFLDCIAAHPEIALRMIVPLCKRVRALTESVKGLALLSVYERVARTLEKLANWQGDKGVINARLTHNDIANMVGSSREMISRVFKDLIADGYVRVEDKKIFIERTLPRRPSM